MPKFRQIDFACPRCRKPLGSGGKRVTTSLHPAGVEVCLHDVADEIAARFGRRRLGVHHASGSSMPAQPDERGHSLHLWWCFGD